MDDPQSGSDCPGHPCGPAQRGLRVRRTVKPHNDGPKSAHAPSSSLEISDRMRSMARCRSDAALRISLMPGPP